MNFFSPKMPFATATLVALFISISSLAGEESWIKWGGPDTNFKVQSGKLASSWPDAGPPVLWKKKFGPGYSAILSENGKLYTVYRRDESDVVVCLEASSGKQLWESAFEAPVHKGQRLSFGTGPNASPVIHGNRIYSVSFGGLLVCLDKTTGKQLWSVDLVARYGALIVNFGVSASPLVYKNQLIVICGGDKYGAVGFNLETGNLVWNSEKTSAGYATPVIINAANHEQLVFMGVDDVWSLSLKTGKVLWQTPYKNRYGTHASPPIPAGDDLLFISTQVDEKSKTLRLSADGDGVKLDVVAENDTFRLFYNNCIRLGDVIYGGSKNKASAYNLKKGEILWQEKGYPVMNMVYADDKFILLDENGKLSLATMTPEKMTVLASHKFLDKPSWTVPTLTGTTLYLRNTKEIMALSLAR